MTEERALESVDDAADTIENRRANHVPRLVGVAVLSCYLVLPVAGIYGWAIAALVVVVASQLLDLVVVSDEDLRAGLARGQLGIATRTVVRELALIALVLTDGWATRDDARAGATLLVGVGGLRLLYHLTMVLVRRRTGLPVETLNIDLTGIRRPPVVPELMKRRLSERFHGLSAVALVGSAVAVVTTAPSVLYVVVGLVLAIEVSAVAAAIGCLLRSRGATIRGAYLAEVYRRVLAMSPEVMLYHSGTADSGHQVNMWLGATEGLQRPAIVALREVACFGALEPTTLPVVCIPDAVDFMTFGLPSVRVALYTANVGKTIHMLREPGVQHVFVGHGDSDKVASFNPFSRVYSEVWVAGEAGRDRYRRAGVGVRDEDIVEVGRPQLAGIVVGVDPVGDRPLTVLYAPTWEGWTGDPAHTSLIRTGPLLVERLVGLPNLRVIYKPHPFTGTVSAEARDADARIRVVLGGAGSRHLTVLGVSPTLYECFNSADLLVADISSVLSDFLSNEKPYVVPNLTGLDEDGFRAEFPSASAAYLLDPAGDRIGAILDLISESDPLAGQRRQLKRYLLGPAEPDAQTRFGAAVDAAYDRAVSLTPHRVAAGAEA